jgi:DNA-binding transcriptional ArsR family regulator
MPNLTTSLDSTFQALADPTRRAVVERLGRGPASVSELAKPFGMALPSFMQHLRMLEECGLVISEKTGRVRVCRLQPGALTSLEGWLERQHATWSQRLDQFDAFVTELNQRTEKK